MMRKCTVHDDLIKHQHIIWGPSPHGIWQGASQKLNPALHILERSFQAQLFKLSNLRNYAPHFVVTCIAYVK